jgi:hypothetical protein
MVNSMSEVNVQFVELYRNDENNAELLVLSKKLLYELGKFASSRRLGMHCR